MFQSDNKANMQNFFYADSEPENQTVHFSMTLDKIRHIINICNNFAYNNNITLNLNNVLNIEKTENFQSIEEIIFSYIAIETEDLIVNLTKSNILYIFCSETGIRNFIDSLLCLLESLNHGKIEDISYMIPEWGGDWLINKQIIKDSYIICHLRLYGII